jgi:Domain of unknown function (DUF4375)
MLTTIFKFFKQFKKSKREIKTAQNYPSSEEIARSVEAFKNRTIHKVLTLEIIDSASDDEIFHIVLDNLSEKLPRDNKKEYETVTSWTKAQQAIYIIWWLDAEVNNGGFNQFYENSSGQYAELLPAALKLIGATKHQYLMVQANNCHRREIEQITRYMDGTVEGFVKSYDDNPLNKFDTQFYKLESKENLQKLMVNFIRQNKENFIDK